MMEVVGIFSFSWTFSSAGGAPLPARILEGQRRTAKLDAPEFLLFHFPFCRTRPNPIGSRTASSSSCDDAQFVLASRSHEVNSTTPSHQTPHTPDAMKTGRDWPLMPTTHPECAPCALLFYGCVRRLVRGSVERQDAVSLLRVAFCR